MDRWACVDITALPLQILLLEYPEWKDRPVAVVDEDKPQGQILVVNRAAHASRIRPGMRYAAGLAMSSKLCAGVVSETEIAATVGKITEALRAYSPDVEPAHGEPGVFWLDASGFEALWKTLEEWADQVAWSVHAQGLRGAVVVGFDRFCTYALARQASWTGGFGQGSSWVLKDAEEERSLASRVSLGLLRLDAKMRAALRRLGIATVGELRRLPADGLFDRFGKEGFDLQRLADGTAYAPLQPEPAAEPVRERFEPDPETGELDQNAVLFLLKSQLGRIAERLAKRGEAVQQLDLALLHEDAPATETSVKPAAPTLREVELIDLLRLRLDAMRLDAPIVGFELGAVSVAASREQLQLFREKPKRDLQAADRALARLCAEFGEAAVVRAALRDGHLPEARFCWEELTNLQPAKAGKGKAARLVRRFLHEPRMVAHQKPLPDGWFVNSFTAGPVMNLVGPYIVSGGWWRKEVHREYYFAETRRGDVLWVFRDRRTRRWFVHGVVE